MNQEPHPPADHALSNLLQGWSVDASLPPRFREAVWRRLALEEDEARWDRLWHGLALRWERLVRKPLGVAACFTFFIAAGAGFGAWHARTFTHQAEAAWQDAYLHSVSPTTLVPSP